MSRHRNVRNLDEDDYYDDDYYDDYYEEDYDEDEYYLEQQREKERKAKLEAEKKAKASSFAGKVRRFTPADALARAKKNAEGKKEGRRFANTI